MKRLIQLIVVTGAAFFISVRATAQENQRLNRIAIGSCSSLRDPQTIWDAIFAWSPELFLHLGDVIYADTNTSRHADKAREMQKVREHYQRLALVPGFKKLRQSSPMLAIWDDHDYGLNDGGFEYAYKEEAQALFLDFFNEPPHSGRRKTPGIYTAKTFGKGAERVQMILLDTRYFRTPLREGQNRRERYLPSNDPHQNLLGEAQWAWLRGELQKPARVRLIASSIQVLSDKHCYESWSRLPLERERLFRLIGELKAKGVVFLSGDRHYSEISRLRLKTVGYPLYDFTSSGLTRSGTEFLEENPHRLSPTHKYFGNNFGTITIDWEQEDPLLRMETRNVQGQLQFFHEFRLSTIE